ncbi:biotin carboxylase N-terminal domain-containing protein [Rhodococcus sp. HNM0569]|uniref:ATP-binding protein n=1 Tax=Rhodococcus sp. HNM0569 TaxID=2716340 RepID=UPI00146B4F0A|nr:biotin carboxylase N-terminal domain-containing protein [Rhodococcus sp. HNM0569]NLU83347.1 ATP-grasp domain-containing protein [Rhodococcus sp. HNM0569]
MFKRIAVVNRGEAAVRLIRAVRELEAEHRLGLTTIALHTEAERRAMFVRQADESVTLHRHSATNPYLDHDELVRALVEARAEAVWVGWGFVAEDPAFAERVRAAGITFIGPSPEAMRLLGDKVEAKLLAEKVGVPVAPWSGGPVATRSDARRHAQAIGFPLIIKARSGGGGRGIRKVWAEDELELALERTQGEAERSFGDPVVFIERLVTDARHVEVQVIADGHGNVWAPGVRDCSIQRRNQKVIEESASPLLSREQADHLRTVSADLVRAAQYQGAATVEYLYQPEQQIFTFLEVNTRLQVEHPITEITTGIDLVKLQILVAAGHELEGECPTEFGHAVEARLNAEDAENGFAPAPGKVELLDFPLGSGLRVDTGIASGDVIPPDYDSMVAKIIAWGRDRSEALARLRTALRETTVVLDGGTTTKSFLLDLLDRREVIDASADTGWLDRAGIGAATGPSRCADIALIAAAVDVYDAEEAFERSAFLATSRGGRPRASHSIGRTVELTYQGQAYSLTVGQVGPHSYHLDGDSGPLDVDIERLGEYRSRVTLGGVPFNVVSIAGPSHHLVEVDGVSHQIGQDEAGVVRAPAPAIVVSVPVAVGDKVDAGSILVVLESMKMETAIRAPHSGTVREIPAVVNSQVDAGAPLLRVDEDGAESAAATTARVEFGLPAAATATQGVDVKSEALALLTVLRAVITGYDVGESRTRALLSNYEWLREQLPYDDGDLVQAELHMLTTFADICELSRQRPTSSEEDTDERVHSPREHFHTFLHSLDAEREQLPDAFCTKLSRALAHYDVADLERTSDLEEAVYRVFLAQQRIENQIPVVAALLERWLRDAKAPAQAATEFGDVLDRVVVATQARFPVLGDVARTLRYRFFDEPRIRAARRAAYDSVRGSLAYLADNPHAADYHDRIEALVATPEPLVDLLADKIATPAADLGPLLEVVTRRNYRIRTLDDVKLAERDGHPMVTGRFELRGELVHLVSVAAPHASFDDVLRGVAADVGSTPRPENFAADVYLRWDGAPVDADAASQALLDQVSRHAALLTCRRVTVVVSGPAGEHTFTYRPDGGALHEDATIRDMHPLTGQRLDLWRLSNFVGTRMPAPADTYLFHLVAAENKADERLVALAEIRDATPQFDDHGEIVGFPTVERTLAAALDAMRRAGAQRRGKRLDANRIVLYVWPEIDFSAERMAIVAKNVAPITAGAGLEQIILMARLREPGAAEARAVALRFSYRPGAGVVLDITDPPTEPMRPLDAYTQKVRRSRARGSVYPYELLPQLSGAGGTFVEHDLDEHGALVPVDRPYGGNTAGIITGVVTTPTPLYPEGMTRVALFGDPTKALGSIAEPEASRVVAAIDLAETMGVPVEWFALSSGAEISMERGTENMDWVSRALRRIITFTQGGGEINIVVAGINVGAQPYWNAEATMLMHTKGVLIMTPDSAMVLTGKHSLDYAGGVSAEDNFGIGGYDRVMGANGQAQYWAPNLTAAIETLFGHYAHTYVVPGERTPRRAQTTDPVTRDVCAYPHVHPESDFTTVGDIFSATANPERKRPFDIRTVMRAVVDQDHAVLERWADMADADTSVVFDAHLGGYPVSVVGIESRAITRKGQFPTDGPDKWTSGTLFPRSSKKTARAINAASGNRPVVVLANLSGFDGSPESMRTWQLEYGAEIGRAIVNFDGPIVFCVVSRYHGGAFVVFSNALNENMEVLAVEGSYASVLGGAPAAAVVFTRDVDRRTSADPRVASLEEQLAAATDEAEQARLRVELDSERTAVRSDKLGEVAAEFEAIHDIERAQRVGSVHRIVAARDLRAELVAAVERKMA